jgi:hypothetical protein
MGPCRHVRFAASLVAHPLAPAWKVIAEARLRKDENLKLSPESKGRP